MLFRAIALACLSLLPISAASAAVAQPEIAFDKTAVVASGLTPGGDVVWFGVAREIAERTATIVRHQEIATDDDGDGSVTFDLGRDVPFQSIWVAIDLTTGASAIAVPDGYPLREADLPVSEVRLGVGEADRIEDSRGYLDILVVRPGVGAWSVTVGDGGPADADGAYDGHLAAATADMHDVSSGEPGPPDHLGPNDVVVVVDPNAMEIGLRKLEEVPQ